MKCTFLRKNEKFRVQKCESGPEGSGVEKKVKKWEGNLEESSK